MNTSIECFWAQKTEMSPIPLNLLESARAKIFCVLDAYMSRTFAVKCFRAQGPYCSLIFLNQEDENFYDHDVDDAYKVGIKCFWAQEA